MIKILNSKNRNFDRELDRLLSNRKKKFNLVQYQLLILLKM